MKRFRTLIAILVACLVASTVSTFGHAQPPAPVDELESLKLDDAERRFSRGIQFAPCPEDATVECGTLTLPVDYNNPQGETFDMAVIRAKATDPSKRIGVLRLNPGGPASSGVDFVLTGIRAPVFIEARERFDMVSFDVRGSHRSRPVRCDVQPGGDPEQVSEVELVALFDDFSRYFAQTCVEQNGPFILTMSHNVRQPNICR